MSLNSFHVPIKAWKISIITHCYYVVKMMCFLKDLLKPCIAAVSPSKGSFGKY